MEYLCHYTTQKNAKKIIKSMTLRFGKVCNSNDPIEMMDVRANLTTGNPWVLQVGGESECVRGAMESYMKIYLNKILQVICFSKGRIKNIEDGVEMNIKDNCIYAIHNDSISAFSERPPYYLPRMWAQYGENHNGVCLIFNKRRLVNQVIKQTQSAYNFKHRDVVYDDLLDSLPLRGHMYEYHEYNAMHIKQFIQEFLEKYSNYYYFTKDIDWRDEQEYRFLLWNKIGNNNYDNKIIKINNKILTGVILGLQNDGSQLKEILLESKIENIHKLEYKGNSIELNKLDLSDPDFIDNALIFGVNNIDILERIGDDSTDWEGMMREKEMPEK